MRSLKGKEEAVGHVQNFDDRLVSAHASAYLASLVFINLTSALARFCNIDEPHPQFQFMQACQTLADRMHGLIDDLLPEVLEKLTWNAMNVHFTPKQIKVNSPSMLGVTTPLELMKYATRCIDAVECELGALDEILKEVPVEASLDDSESFSNGCYLLLCQLAAFQSSVQMCHPMIQQMLDRATVVSQVALFAQSITTARPELDDSEQSTPPHLTSKGN